MHNKKTGRNGGNRTTLNGDTHPKYSPAARSKKGQKPSFVRARRRSEPTIRDRIRDALCYIDPSPRCLWIRIAMALKSELGEAGFEIWNSWSKKDDSYDAKDALATWKSIKQDGGITIGTLFFEAKRNGWPGSR